MNPRKFVRNASLLLVAGSVLASAAFLTACGDDDDDAEPTTAPMATTLPSDSPRFTAGDIEVTNVRARASTNETSAVYMNIESTGAPDRLVSASVADSIADEAQIHETVVDGSAMKMQELDQGLVIPADGMVELKTGGYHVMLLGLEAPLVEGEELTVTLVFETAGELEVTAPIVSIAMGTSMK